jgi:bifunctional non-homologous end joining protein LigD
MPKRTVQEVVVGRRRLEISNVDKVFYPSGGFTKGDMISFYRDISEVLLPHLKGRPVTLKRFPDGAEGSFFYEKECPKYAPDWIKTAPITRRRDNVDVNYCLLDTQPALVWAANLANLELHTVLARARDVTKPIALVFDLDPGEPLGVIACADIALRLKKMFGSFGLDMLVKTSGSKGLQAYVPLNTKVTYEQTKAFAQDVARRMEKDHPSEIISKPSREQRKGKIFIDWSQNDLHKTTVSVYSLRAKERPTVSTPVTWEEVRKAVKKDDAALLTFEYDEVLKRVARRGDLFEPVLKMKQKLPAL